MATTQLNDVFIPEVYASMMENNTPDRIEFVTSGAVVSQPIFTQLIGQQGQVGTVPFFNDLDSTPASVSSDNPAYLIIPDKVTTGTQTFVLQSLNRAFQFADFAMQRGLADPMQYTRNRFARYWQGELQARIVGTLKGIMADNIANNAGDMTTDKYAPSGTPVDDNRFSRDSFLEALGTMGDNYGAIQTAVVHSVIYNRITQLEASNVQTDAQTGMPLAYLGQQVRLVVDDGVPTETINGQTVYTTVLLGNGTIGYGNIPVPQAFELDHNPDAGNGRGVTSIYERQDWVIHPFGFGWNTNLTSVTRASLEDAANWTRVYGAKSIPIRFLRTN